MRRRALLWLVLPLFVAGCNEGEREFYQSRYIPTSSDDSFSSYSRASWNGDEQVYELPSQPPSIDDGRPRNECTVPGPRFKERPMLGVSAIVRGSDDGGPLDPIADEQKTPYPLDGLTTDTPQAVAAYGKHPPGPILSHGIDNPVADSDNRPRSRTGYPFDRNKVDPTGSLGDQAKTDYCLPDEVPDHVHGIPSTLPPSAPAP